VNAIIGGTECRRTAYESGIVRVGGGLSEHNAFSTDSTRGILGRRIRMRREMVLAGEEALKFAVSIS